VSLLLQSEIINLQFPANSSYEFTRNLKPEAWRPKPYASILASRSRTTAFSDVTGE
jgi:hypothetical protein